MNPTRSNKILKEGISTVSTKAIQVSNKPMSLKGELSISDYLLK